MRKTLLFNDNWLFRPEIADTDAPDSSFEAITLPHSNATLPWHNFDDQEYQFVSTYRKRFSLPEPLNGRRLYIDFDGAMIASTVQINDHTFPEYRGGYTPFSFDITDYVTEDGENLLTVHLDSTERPDIPPFGYVVDYLTFGGIYRDVRLRYVNPVHIDNMRVRTYDVRTGEPRAEIDIFIRNDSDTVQDVTVVGGMEYWKDEIAQASVPPQQTVRISLQTSLAGMPAGSYKLWTLDQPNLFFFQASLHPATTALSANDVELDQMRVRVGFRDAEFREDGFYLNGERLQLRGLNRHQTYPYIGAAASSRLQERDAEIVKWELGCNIVRTSHYPQSPYFIDRCDEIGLLVFEEIPGWQHIGDEEWKQVSLRDVRAMIERDWNHPSIILWGVRINESLDDHDFYAATNKLARELDPTRQTGGVRYFPNSEFLEDVFTYNDFSNGVIEPTQSPWLITEFNGHMFPTKTWDNEERRIEHALRHARIQAQAAYTGGVSGAIGWCAFDYNTHKEFGSGDRICYHGVMDMFRLPKYAASFYASQISPDQRIVLQAATIWSMGDRSAGGNDPVMIFSNCEEVEVFVGDERIGRFQPDSENYPGLPHPPFKATGLGTRWGKAFDDLRVVGYINGQPVAEQMIGADGQPDRLLLQADDDVLHADGMDMTRIVFKVVDRYGNVLPYATKVVQFEIEGPGQLIGDNPFALIGGQAAMYLRATHESGTVTIRARAERLEPVSVQVRMD